MLTGEIEQRCPREGTIWLSTGTDAVRKATRCKTWTCKSCRSSVAALVRLRLEHHVSMVTPCFFITLTVALNDGSQLSTKAARNLPMSKSKKWRRVPGAKENAVGVSVLWARFLFKLSRRLRPRTLAWFRVVELTKKGQPHLHLLMTGLETLRPFIRDTIRADWLWATGDSYVVDVQEVYDANGAVQYLSKYIEKSFGLRSRMEEIGFRRRFSRSRSWNGGDQLQLRGTATLRTVGTKRRSVWFSDNGARRPIWTKGRQGHYADFHRRHSKTFRMADTIGDDLSLWIVAKRNERRLLGVARRLQHALNT